VAREMKMGEYTEETLELEGGREAGREGGVSEEGERAVDACVLGCFVVVGPRGGSGSAGSEEEEDGGVAEETLDLEGGRGRGRSVRVVRRMPPSLPPSLLLTR